MSDIDNIINSPYLTFKFILKKKMNEEDISYDVAYLASILRNNQNLNKIYIRYIIKNKHTFTSDKYMFNHKNIVYLLTLLQEEAVPQLQPALLKERSFDTSHKKYRSYLSSKKTLRKKKN